MARHQRLLPFDGPLQAYADHLECILLSVYGSIDQVRQGVLSRGDVVATSAPEILAPTWATDNAMGKSLTAPRTARRTSRQITNGLEISDATNSSISQPPTPAQAIQVATSIQFLARVPENEQEWLQLEASSGLNCSGHDIFHRVTQAQNQIQVTAASVLSSTATTNHTQVESSGIARITSSASIIVRTSTISVVPLLSISSSSAGTLCTPEGDWRCVNGSSYQRCASGSWSAIQRLPVGVSCSPGQASMFDMVEST
ncbi:hypothetical protein BKA67DRAFT_660161 [Truncatella angustata]|uniref:Uncharacterized protein n=1 Tax=Truncatella angustata TaxID=152316 RepID=A0A9P8UJZ6_9PEZI|nr:uncharacterized protein BKA67DRAFT_660161 [Truncatella angustata]KAH6653576.1 hypothetical protein BKA67DRAFT_660161 [Truncatella angustata]